MSSRFNRSRNLVEAGRAGAASAHDRRRHRKCEDFECGYLQRPPSAVPRVHSLAPAFLAGRERTRNARAGPFQMPAYATHVAAPRCVRPSASIGSALPVFGGDTLFSIYEGPMGLPTPRIRARCPPRALQAFFTRAPIHSCVSTISGNGPLERRTKCGSNASWMQWCFPGRFHTPC